MKNKLFPFISILVLLILFGTAATCNMCGFGLTTPTVATEKAVSETTDSQEDNTSAETAIVEETVAEDETVEETVAEETKETTDSKTTDSQKEAPTIKLEIYEGPTYSQTDNVCYYRIKATVTGDPVPTVTFSKDDSNGAFGSKKVQVNLTKSSPSYTLTAIAKNSAGEAKYSITLNWGCSQPKVEKTVQFMTSDYVSVGPYGYKGLQMLGIGDSPYNTDCRGRFAFDVSSLSGKEIIYAKVSLVKPQLSANPCNFKGDILIFYNDFLPDLSAQDYYSAAYAGPEVFAWDADPLEFSNDFLKDKVKERADSGIKLQFGIGYQNSNTGGVKDIFEGRAYYSTNINITVTYYE